MPNTTAAAASATPAASELDPAISLPVVARCWNAFQRAYKAALDADKSEFSALYLARRAYSRSMPAPLDPPSVAEFIACVTFGSACGVFEPKQANTLLYAAQVALSLHRRTGEKKSLPKKP